MNRIQKAFETKAFIGFLTAGDPSLEKTVEYILEMEKAGATLIEIGIPFSDPIAEGPIIQEANIRALSQGMTTDKVFEIVKRVREVSQIALCFMTYLNPVFHYGYHQFFKKCQEVGVDGIIIPDCPFEESQEVKSVCEHYHVQMISMIAPTSKQRIVDIAKEATGFIYLVSSMGVTGMRENIQTDIQGIINDIKEVTDVPVAIGFGVSTPQQVHQLSQFANGVIVGSAIIHMIQENDENAKQALYDYVHSMIMALD